MGNGHHPAKHPDYGFRTGRGLAISLKAHPLLDAGSGPFSGRAGRLFARIAEHMDLDRLTTLHQGIASTGFFGQSVPCDRVLQVFSTYSWHVSPNPCCRARTSLHLGGPGTAWACSLSGHLHRTSAPAKALISLALVVGAEVLSYAAEPI